MPEPNPFSTDTLVREPQRVECAQAELVAVHPELFTEPAGVIASRQESPEAIQAFTFETAKAKLDALPYVTGTKYSYDVSKIRTTYVSEEGFQIPTSRIIAASGYDQDQPPSWSGRAGGYESANGVRSLDKIIDYAQQGKYEQREHSIEEKIVANVVYSPNGEAFFILDGGNHRGSAAKLRGDATLAVKYIHLTSPDEATLDRYQVEPLYGAELSRYIPEPTAKQLGLLTIEEWRKSKGIEDSPAPVVQETVSTPVAPVRRHRFRDRFKGTK